MTFEAQIAADRVARDRLNWWNQRLVVFDVETSGFDPHVHRVISLGVAVFEHGALQWSAGRLVHPGFDPRYIDPKVLKLTGLSPTELMNAPPFWAVYNELAPHIEGLPVAYNAPFDRRFMLSEVARCWPARAFQTVPQWMRRDVPWVDPCALARTLLTLHGYKLADVARALGFPQRERHAAEADAISAGEIAVALGRVYQPSPTDAIRRQREARAHRVVEKEVTPKGETPQTGKYTLFECDICQDVTSTRDGKRPADWAFFDKDLTTCGPACDIVAGWLRGRW